MLLHVRPWQIFTTVPAPSNDRVIQMKLPERRDIATLETCLLIAALKLTRAEHIFEFGTFRGNTTMNLALNCAPGGRVWTFDLDSADGLTQHPADAPLTVEHFATMPAYIGSEIQHRIEEVTGNSLTVDLTRFDHSMDLVFVDGGHDATTAAADSRWAFRMLREGGIIAWHDYGDPVYPGLTEYLDDLSKQRPLVAVEETRLVFFGFKLPGVPEHLY